jgi:hypothetical protein
METLLTTLSDFGWVREVHIPDLDPLRFKVIRIVGNEDAPNRIECYRRDHYKCVPAVYVFAPDKGHYVLTTKGEEYA